jgi:uncharacterized membrane protein YgaE (UPF0421/DUF939 family)
LVLWMLMIDDSESPAHWFVERVGMTLLGVVLALVSALLIPKAARALEAYQRSRSNRAS